MPTRARHQITTLAAARAHRKALHGTATTSNDQIRPSKTQTTSTAQPETPTTANHRRHTPTQSKPRTKTKT